MSTAPRAAAAALALGLAAAPGAPPPPLVDLARAVEAAARAADPAESRRLAAAVVPDLRRVAAAAPRPCQGLLVLAEAELRAGLPGDARATLERAKGAGCHPAIVTHLEAWSLEYGEGGVRRGVGAPLREAEGAYVRAALLAPSLGDGADALAASALERAAELALLRGDAADCAGILARALQLAVPQDTEVRLALAHLDCGAASVGEGAALDALHAVLDPDVIDRVAVARLASLKQRLDLNGDDAVALASVAYHAFLARDQPQNLVAARRYLVRAAEVHAGLPDVWYLLGRVHDELGSIEEAKANFREQVRRHAGAPASRLAANDLAYLAATTASSQGDLAAALAVIDAEIARTPAVAPFHDTRARVLLALGRRAEALAAFDRSLTLAKDPDVAAARDRLAAEIARAPR